MKQGKLRMRRTVCGMVAVFLVVAALRFFFPERAMDQTGPRAILDALFALCLLAGTLTLAGAIGIKGLRILRLTSLSTAEQTLISASLGLGVLAYLVLALGLLGLLKPWLMLLLFLLIGAWLRKELSQCVVHVSRVGGGLWRTVRSGPLYMRALIVLGGLVALLSLLQSLAPPTGVDGLIYHLPVPAMYLDKGRMISTPDFTPAAFPSTIEMLFAIGQAFGSDVFSQLINLAFLSMFLAGTVLAGRRFIGRGGGWLAGAILLGMPVLPIWGTLPYVDLGWSLYEFLGIYMILIWAEHRNVSATVLSGLFFGLAAGSKYLALGGCAAVVLVTLLYARRDGVRSAAKTLALFGTAAILVASPWYLRNWLWYGNPFYPFYQGIFGGSVEPLAGLSSHRLNYGIVDYLLVPLRMFFDRRQFAGVYGSIEFLSPFFLIAIAYPFMRGKGRLDRMAVFALVRYIFWAFTTPTRTRYMLPIFPVLSLLASHVAIVIMDRARLRKLVRILGGGLLGGLLAATLLYSILFLVDVNPTGVVAGYESKDSFLARRLTDYAAMKFIRQELPPDARVMMLYDSRTYYCDDRCVPDLFQVRWEGIVSPDPTVSSVVHELRREGITHLLLGLEDANYHFYYVPDDLHTSLMRFFYDDLVPACAETIYEDEWTSLYELTCY